ncbi:pyridoxal phosphate-dependent aminotransferase [Nocardioides sp. YIM 123512]|uniref:Pyridoxal phosphate-dependent aminotransferase n=1 Tax=Nocardioides flavescens TaxID=2691959 RepID=A0A6L7ER47_9ACTN|nr:pyridoxal phosphate-dependent aminotransferase [Nocardioides flavescens]MXG89743.1 pyridoxal phosphate-dependent aminotransferase [Nocardioides flavescens]
MATRLQGIAPTIFTQMSALAVRTGSVNLGQGFPDADGPPSVIAAAVAALEGGRNQYAPGPGVPDLRSAVARHQARHYGLELDPDTQVVITTGCTEAVAGALLGLVDPGDEVVVLEPYYDSYRAVLQMVGGVRRPVTLRAPAFRLDVDELRAAVTPRTRFVLLNSPHNPTGTVLTRAELQAVADVAIEHDLVVITDEVYEHLVYDGVEHVPIATLPGMAERTLTLSSAGKSYSFTGWKVGWATGPAELVAAVLAAKQWLTFTSGSPLQPAVALALDSEPDFPADLARDLQSRRDLLLSGLASAGLPAASVPRGAYFATTDVRHLGWSDAMEFCLALPERAGVVAIPSQVFYDDQAEGAHLVRFTFCKDRSVIESGVSRLASADLAR